MFNKNNKKVVDIEKEKKAIIDSKMELYKDRKELMVDIEFNQARKSLSSDFNAFHFQINDQKLEVEKELFRRTGDRNVELAKLDAEILFKRELIDEVKNFVAVRAERDSYKAKADASELICKSKDETIALLDGIVKVVVGKLSKVDVGSLAVHVAPTKAE